MLSRTIILMKHHKNNQSNDQTETNSFLFKDPGLKNKTKQNKTIKFWIDTRYDNDMEMIKIMIKNTRWTIKQNKIVIDTNQMQYN